MTRSAVLMSSAREGLKSYLAVASRRCGATREPRTCEFLDGRAALAVAAKLAQWSRQRASAGGCLLTNHSISIPASDSLAGRALPRPTCSLIRPYPLARSTCTRHPPSTRRTAQRPAVWGHRHKSITFDVGTDNPQAPPCQHATGGRTRTRSPFRHLGDLERRCVGDELIKLGRPDGHEDGSRSHV